MGKRAVLVSFHLLGRLHKIMRYCSNNSLKFESCILGSFYVLSPNSITEGQSEATTTVTASEPITAVTTSTSQALSSVQPQAGFGPKKAPNRVWKILGGILGGLTVGSLLILATYYWRRHQNVKLKMIIPCKFSPRAFY